MADAVLAGFRRRGVGCDTRVIYFRSDFGSAGWVCLGRFVLPDLVFSFSTLFLLMMSSVVCLYGVWLRFCGAHDVCVQCLLAWVTPVREYVECIYDFFLSSSDNENSILYISLELRNISSVR